MFNVANKERSFDFLLIFLEVGEDVFIVFLSQTQTVFDRIFWFGGLFLLGFALGFVFYLKPAVALVLGDVGIEEVIFLFDRLGEIALAIDYLVLFQLVLELLSFVLLSVSLTLDDVVDLVGEALIQGLFGHDGAGEGGRED